MGLREFLFGPRIAETPAPPPAPKPLPDPEEFYRSLLSSLGEGLLAVDSGKRILLCNEPMSRILNRPASEAAGLSLWDVLRTRAVNELADRVLAGREEGSVELPPTVPDDRIWLVKARPFARAGAPAGAVLVFTDVTDLRRLETVRRDFVANVSHELKTPLTALRAALETLLEGAVDDPRHAKEFLETAQQNVDRLQRLIDDLLTLGRLEKTGAGVGPARALFRGVAEKVWLTIRPLAEKARVRMEKGWSAESLALPVSEDELTQILLNLLDNAVKFNRPDGTVTLAARRAGTMAEIVVRDTGDGIPPADLPRIFERFYRVDKSHSRERAGTGLGLSIVKHIVENRGGAVSVQSGPGRGSVFTVTLPLI